MLDISNRFNTDAFTWDKSSRVLVAFASDLGLKPGVIPVELFLTSHRTGREELFTLDMIEEDGSLKFEARDERLNKEGVTVHIFND